LRSNLFAELRFSNQEGVGDKVGDFSEFPDREVAQYQGLGEPAYVAQKKALVLQFVREHPGEFLRRCLHRILKYWTGPEAMGWIWYLVTGLMLAGIVLGWHRYGRDMGIFILTVALYPIVYYLTYTFPKYRHPIEPAIVLLAAISVSAAIRRLLPKTKAEPAS
jgi:hypothetical protein